MDIEKLIELLVIAKERDDIKKVCILKNEDDNYFCLEEIDYISYDINNGRVVLIPMYL